MIGENGERGRTKKDGGNERGGRGKWKRGRKERDMSEEWEGGDRERERGEKYKKIDGRMGKERQEQ
jgi:hypothetical protein